MRSGGRCVGFQFPSPQGGSETTQTELEKFLAQRFPSPQGGSETSKTPIPEQPQSLFPSPQGGSETGINEPVPMPVMIVSIPSRRVGDNAIP